MQRPSQKTIPFARDGQKNDIPTSGASTDENASYQMGFPPRTMTNDASAVPPTGEDINGILNQLSVASIYQQAGGMYPFSGTFAQAIGGYPKGAIVLKSDGTGHWMNTVDNNLTNPDSGGSGWSDFSAKMMVGATDLTNGQSGAAPAPLIADRYKFLCGDGTWKPAQTRNLYELVWSALPLTDAGLHLIDGTKLLFGGAYNAFCLGVKRIHDAGICPYAFISEDDWQESVSTNGSCGKFVVTADGVRLPKVSDILQGTTDLSAVGDLVEAGLPNIMGNLASIVKLTGGIGEGAFSLKGDYSNGVTTGSSLTTKLGEAVFDASRSSSYYRNDVTKPTPQNIKYLLYICVATSVKTPVEVDIDNVITDVNNKTDRDFANVTDTAKAVMARMAMPSGQYIDLTLPSSGSTLTAPEDGYVSFGKSINAAGQYIRLTSGNMSTSFMGHASGNNLRTFIPVKKGAVVNVWYSAGGATDEFRFIYAEGANK